MVVTSSTSTRLILGVLFLVSCVADGVFIFGANIWRLIPRPGRSGRYRVAHVHMNYDSCTDATADDDDDDDDDDVSYPNVNFYFTSPFEHLEMDNFQQRNVRKHGNSSFTTNFPM